jgi:hypothetical protein
MRLIHKLTKYCQYLLLADIKELDIKAKQFEYNELRIATKNFAKERKLGAGAYGVVYKVIKFNVIGFQKTHTHVALLGICDYNTKLKDIN